MDVVGGAGGGGFRSNEPLSCRKSACIFTREIIDAVLFAGLSALGGDSGHILNVSLTAARQELPQDFTVNLVRRW